MHVYSDDFQVRIDWQQALAESKSALTFKYGLTGSRPAQLLATLLLLPCCVLV